MDRIKKYWLIVLFQVIFLICLLVPLFADQMAQKVDLIPLDFGIKQSIVSVGNTATPIPTTAYSGRKSIIIKNLDASVVVYIGSSTVTADEATTGGYPLAENDTLKIDLGQTTVIYGITTSSAKVSIIEAR